MIIRKGDIIELYIEKIAFGGKGIARFNGFVIFVPGVIPGDRVIAKIIKKKRDYANAALLEILDPSPDRISPPCTYNGYCGGCQMQHLKYERQLEYKREYIIDSMTRIGMLPDIFVHSVIPSDNIFEYRNKMEFSFSDRRWLPPEEFIRGQEKNIDFGLGLHIPETFYKVLDIDTCLLQPKLGNQIMCEVKRFVKQSSISAYSLKKHTGFWRFLILRHSRKRNEWMVNIVTSEERFDVVSSLSKVLYKKFSNIITIINNINPGKAGIAIGEKEIILSGDGYLIDTIGPYDFQISPNSFFQTNTYGAEKLYSKVLEFARLTGTETVLDLYCGTGTIPVFLSGKAKEIIGMEISQSAVSDATVNCRLNDVNNCRFVLGDIIDNLPSLRENPDVIIIDPPRAGIHKKILSGIREMGAETIVYVSCNPSTMARDLKYLSEMYEILEIQPVDMFPHTYHIEAVARMVRK